MSLPQKVFFNPKCDKLKWCSHRKSPEICFSIKNERNNDNFLTRNEPCIKSSFSSKIEQIRIISLLEGIHKQKSCFLIQNIKNNDNLIIRMLFAQKTHVSIQDVKSREFYDYKWS